MIVETIIQNTNVQLNTVNNTLLFGLHDPLASSTVYMY